MAKFPRKFGGGKPEYVRLVLKDIASPIANILSADKSVTARIELVAQSDKELIVLTPIPSIPTVVRLNRAVVDATIREVKQD
jgi:hypothetical protein